MNWGKGLALALIAFACMMAWFVVKAAQNPEPLVTEDYYGAELNFQGRIDETVRANSLSAPVRIDLQRRSVVIHFPIEMKGEHINGTLSLLRPNDPRADGAVTIRTDSAVFTTNAITLKPGRYNAALSWHMNGIAYHTEEKVFVP